MSFNFNRIWFVVKMKSKIIKLKNGIDKHSPNLKAAFIRMQKKLTSLADFLILIKRSVG